MVQISGYISATDVSKLADNKEEWVKVSAAPTDEQSFLLTFNPLDPKLLITASQIDQGEISIRQYRKAV